MNVQDLSVSALALMILTSSFFGSWHCAGMCSPLASVASQQGQLIHYHLGRLFSYVTLGFISGALGNFFLESEFKWLQTASILSLSSFLILLGYFSFKNEDLHSRLKFDRVLKFLFQLQKKFKLHTGLSIGLITGVLPCGWLYTYLLASATTKSPMTGALVMLLFGLGGIPALSTVSVLVHKKIISSHAKKRKIAGGILIVAGLYALISHFMFGFNLVPAL